MVDELAVILLESFFSFLARKRGLDGVARSIFFFLLATISTTTMISGFECDFAKKTILEELLVRALVSLEDKLFHDVFILLIIIFHKIFSFSLQTARAPLTLTCFSGQTTPSTTCLRSILHNVLSLTSSGATKPWKCVYKDSVSEEDEDVIEEMMEKIEDNTCLRFRWTIVMIIVVKMQWLVIPFNNHCSK